MTGQQQFTETQRLAWAIGAYDIQVDIPTDDDASNDAEMFRQWAEQDHGAAARRFIATHDALQDIRFGPETSPYPFAASSTRGFVACIDPRCDHDASQRILCSPAVEAVEAVEIDPDVPDAAEHFARQVHAITVEHDDDHELRDRMIANLAVAYAGQFLPGWVPGVPHPFPGPRGDRRPVLPRRGRSIRRRLLRRGDGRGRAWVHLRR